MKALQGYPNHVATALAKLDKLNPEFIDETISELVISEGYRDLVGSARRHAVEILEAATQ